MHLKSAALIGKVFMKAIFTRRDLKEVQIDGLDVSICPRPNASKAVFCIKDDDLNPAMTSDTARNISQSLLADFYSTIYEYGLKATVCIIPHYKSRFFSENPDFLKLCALIRAYGFEIAGHGYNHSTLRGKSYEAQREALEKMFSEFAKNKIAVLTLAPPGNAYDINTVKAARDAGLEVMVAKNLWREFDLSQGNVLIGISGFTYHDFEQGSTTSIEHLKREFDVAYRLNPIYILQTHAWAFDRQDISTFAKQAQYILSKQGILPMTIGEIGSYLNRAAKVDVAGKRRNDKIFLTLSSKEPIDGLTLVVHPLTKRVCSVNGSLHFWRHEGKKVYVVLPRFQGEKQIVISCEKPVAPHLVASNLFLLSTSWEDNTLSFKIRDQNRPIGTFILDAAGLGLPSKILTNGGRLIECTENQPNIYKIRIEEPQFCQFQFA